MTVYKIPGVYSTVDASAAVSSLSENQSVICIIAKGTSDDTVTALTNKAYAPFSFGDAQLKYGSDSNIVNLMDIALENGGKRFIIVRIDDTPTPDYASALNVAELEEAIDIIITDTVSPTDFILIKNHCKAASDNRKERFAIVGYDAGTDMNTVTTNTKTLNTGLIYTSYPNPLNVNGVELSGMYSAAALAGQIAAETDPSMPMTNVELIGFYGLSKKLKDSEMEALIDAGVIPLETRNGSIRIVRAVSTYTKNAIGETDITWQELTTVRVTHYVFKDLRSTLANSFNRSKQSKRTRDGIKSKVLSRLITYQDLEYIENVKNNDVSIAISPFNPLQNEVEFKYDVTGPLNVIHLTGHLVI